MIKIDEAKERLLKAGFTSDLESSNKGIKTTYFKDSCWMLFTIKSYESTGNVKEICGVPGYWSVINKTWYRGDEAFEYALKENHKYAFILDIFRFKKK